MKPSSRQELGVALAKSAVQSACELNWIERMWANSKRYCREHCMYALQGLREVVPISLSQNIDELPGHLQQQQSDELPVSPLYIHAALLGAHLAPVYASDHQYRLGKDACDAINLAVTGQRTRPHKHLTNTIGTQGIVDVGGWRLKYLHLLQACMWVILAARMLL